VEKRIFLEWYDINMLEYGSEEMFFEDTYFEGEERDGFYIAPMMKRAWAAQLEVLKEIDSICVKYGIDYFAEWGTILGAIRHQGIIPWDDDIDIGMKRADYIKFCNVVEKELPQGYEFLSVEKDNTWSESLSRVVNDTVVPLRGEKLNRFHGFPYLAGIDIFVIDNIPPNEGEESILRNLYCATFGLAQKWDEEGYSEEEKMHDLRVVEELCNVKLDESKSFQRQLFILGDRIASMYWDIGAGAKEVAIMHRLAENPLFKVPASCYESTVRVPFENTTIPIPVGYDAILTLYYGNDYMIPKQGGAGHDYPFYAKQQSELFAEYEKAGVEIPKYLIE